MPQHFEGLIAQLNSLQVARRIGRIAALEAGRIRVTGLSDVAALGDRLRLNGREGEVIGLSASDLIVLPEEPPEGLAIGGPVEHLGPPMLAPDDAWIGRIVDPLGRPLDGRPLLPGAAPRPFTAPPPPAAQRRALGHRLTTGLALFNTLLPLVTGQRIGLFAGSGVGKSTLLAQLARGIEADIVVIALIGERGREVREFVEEVLGPEGMARAVVVAATSDQSPLMRRRCALAAMAVAEHFRDRGRHVLLLADSITRFAEAHREVATAAGEAASLRGFPPSTSHAIMSLAERAGPGRADQGDITAVFTVLVAGSDMDEPVADILRGTIDGHVVMDRAIAERGRFPAVDVLRSVSRSLPAAATPEENAQIQAARRVLGAWDRAEMMVQAGLYAKGSDPAVDEALRIWPHLDAFCAGTAGDIPSAFAGLAACLKR
ncbi:FliI/YscN family ATPase [Falsirhodobacter algicola]|uniref:FliI/YscN family ATPase n=1 Tax=Falsirhodobacter algicola TaxID=2692330 RepID=A0A8J8SL11_9RHOB|nr:FliI/YscN family ATPase [Falsirhodobacter algicola]QUS35936.1 FliI/YscN family ATPase [Falsirhodobacter algicola]